MTACVKRCVITVFCTRERFSSCMYLRHWEGDAVDVTFADVTLTEAPQQHH